MSQAESLQGYSLPLFLFESEISAHLKARDEYGGAKRTPAFPHSNFLKGVKWSPDGGCLATASEDTSLRLFDVPEKIGEMAALGSTEDPVKLAKAPDNWKPAISMSEGETIYDYSWFPAMSAADPVSCVLASTCRAHPIHLWDACTGALRCSYRAYNAVDEVTAAYSLAFAPDGSHLYGGFSRAIRVWDVSRPGRDYQELVTFKKGTDGLPGIVSCMSFSLGQSGLMAAGSYSGQSALYDSRTHELLFLLQGQKGGLTQVQFSPDGNFLFAGARADREIWCWDVRYQTGVVYKMERDTGETNQRMQFDIEPCGKHLASGGQDGQVRVFDLSVGKLVKSFTASEDTVNGFQFHPFLPHAATASGQRRFATGNSSESESGSDEAYQPKPSPLSGLDNALLVWSFQHSWMSFDPPAEPAEGNGILTTDKENEEIGRG